MKKTGVQAPYNHAKIEKKWRAYWDEQKTYQTLKAQKAVAAKMKPWYVLDMFPYPSGAGLHVGHPRGYISSDIVARMKRMQGFNVLHPMGFDSFGLPAEQYAIKTGKNPAAFTDVLVKKYREQLAIMGLSYDWSREVSTHDPAYYKWTQWIFLQLYDAWYDPKAKKARPIATLVASLEKKKSWQALSAQQKEAYLMKYRIAYEGFAEINWCPELATVLANDEIYEKDGVMLSERGDFPVEKRSMRQWFMRITAFADRLIDDLDALAWPDHIKEIQKNWIGRSEGSELYFSLSVGGRPVGAIVGEPADNAINGNAVSVFTTRADTLFGVTYVVLAPEHALVAALLPHIENRARVEQYIASLKQLSDQDRTNGAREKTGICLKGVTATNPVNGEQVPVWVADYVLASYGTGAVMAVPAHDERDFAFAKKYNLPIVGVIEGYDGIAAHTAHGMLVHSGVFSGMTSEQAKKAITEKVKGLLTTKYKMRDAIFARQRYWGEPIPLIHKKGSKDSEKNSDSIRALSEKKLPLILPIVKSYKPSGTGESPLAKVAEWVQAGYETNTMPGWAGSSWYFLRYMDPHNAKAFADKKELDYWKQVNVYVGGQEHATGHLLYSRFWHKALHDLGFVPTKEPFKHLRNQGLILAEDGRKMSKRWGNVINPDDIVKTYGADTLRVYEMFMGPFEATLPWSTESIIGARRFLDRVWRLREKVLAKNGANTSTEAKVQLHKTIKKVSDDIASFSFNTAISAMMICLNTFEKESSLGADEYKAFVQLLAPFAPHMAEELWASLHDSNMGSSDRSVRSVHLSGWPVAKKSLLVEKVVTVGVQINGKVRGELTIAPDAPKEAYEMQAMSLPKIAELLAGKTVARIVVVPGRIVNIVTS